MSPRAFSLAAGVVFLLIALAHALRVVFAVPVEVAGIAIPVSSSAAAALFMGYLAYEAFRLSRRAGR